MSDEKILYDLLSRNESALTALEQQYGRLCTSIARKILSDERDIEECVNDTWLHIWNAVPPEKPQSLRAYAARITRNLSLDRAEYNSAERRSSALTTAFEELEFSLPVNHSPRTEEDQQAFSQMLNRFLRGLSHENRTFFLRRYWYGDGVSEIAKACGVSEGKVKSSLFRTRNRLRESMLKEGIFI